MACYARQARHAVAVELAPSYCRQLETRAAALQVTGNNRTFEVICADYRSERAWSRLDADVIVWWQQAPELTNLQVLGVLRKAQLHGVVRSTAVAMFGVDGSFAADRESLRSLQERRWVVDALNISFNEVSNRPARAAERARTRHTTCAHAQPAVSRREEA